MDIKEIIIKKGIIKKNKKGGGKQMGEYHSFIFTENICKSKRYSKKSDLLDNQ